MRGQIGDLGCTHLHRVLKLAALERELAARPVHSHVVCHEEALKVQDESVPALLERAAQNLDPPTPLRVENFNFT
jgi:hypothetical protein